MTVLLDCLLLLSSFILLYTHQQIHTLIQLLFLLFLLFIISFNLGHTANFILASPLITPDHIVPE